MNNKKIRDIFVFGNEFFEGDEVAIEIAKKIENNNKKFKFIFANSPNEILNANDELIILDVVKGLKNVSIINKIDDLVLENSVTCHDLDLGFYLKLMKETGKINDVKIIGIPFENKDYDLLIREVEKILKTI